MLALEQAQQRRANGSGTMSALRTLHPERARRKHSSRAGRTCGCSDLAVRVRAPASPRPVPTASPETARATQGLITASELISL